MGGWWWVLECRVVGVLGETNGGQGSGWPSDGRGLPDGRSADGPAGREGAAGKGWGRRSGPALASGFRTDPQQSAHSSSYRSFDVTSGW